MLPVGLLSFELLSACNWEEASDEDNNKAKAEIKLRKQVSEYIIIISNVTLSEHLPVVFTIIVYRLLLKSF